MGTLPASIHKYAQVLDRYIDSAAASLLDSPTLPQLPCHSNSLQSHRTKCWTPVETTVRYHLHPACLCLSRWKTFQSFEMQLWGQNLQGTELLLQWHAMTTCMTRLALWTCSQSSTRHLTCQINLLIPVATAIIRYHTSQTKAYQTPLKANACVSNARIPDSGSSWG